ncbi:MAG: CoA-binding protein [Phycisphaeraceae bacterium]
MTLDQDPTAQQSTGDTDAFLNGGPFAVVGASADRSKYGNKVLRVYLQNKKKVFPVNPRGGEIEGLQAYPDLASLPELPHGVSIITPPSVTERVVEQAVQLGIEHLWMQPGAESDAAIAYARDHGVNVVAKGPCALVVMGFRGP